MTVPTSYPGVYIAEFTPGAPIEGVGTSTAAFIGPAAEGELNLPTKITSWDQFRTTFGDQPLPGFFLWYAVRGFFDNNGQVCYVVRASNGAYAELALVDRVAATPEHRVIRIRARQPGAPAAPIRIAVAPSHLLQIPNGAYRPAGSLSAVPAGREITLQVGEGAQFRPGDWITIAAAGERLQVARVSADTLRLNANVTGVYAVNHAVRLANAPVGTLTVRLQSAVAIPPNALVPGTILTLTQGGPPDSQVVDTVQPEYLGGGVVTYRVTFQRGLAIPLNLDPAAAPVVVQSEEFDVTISQGAGATPYAFLSIDPAHPRYYQSAINDDANGLVNATPFEPPPVALPPNNLPLNVAATALLGGAPESLANIGDPQYLAALDTLRQIDDVNLVAVPDRRTLAVQQAVITHCEGLGDRFAVLDSQPGVALFGAGSVETQRQGLDSTRGYAALYYPWLRVSPVGAGDPILVPPSGHVCGFIARSDNTRGVHKAPANEIVRGALGVERSMSDIDQGQLNLEGINIVRIFSSGGRPVLWGARTTATDRNWQYVSTRRLFLFLEKSIEKGIRWAVFEPNNQALWQKLKRTITDFLTSVWRDGAMFGETPEQAFYVRIDEVLNPFSEQQLGRLHIEIGIRPAYPAEFIVVRIGIWSGGSQVTET